jgi:hypothetical protein
MAGKNGYKQLNKDTEQKAQLGVICASGAKST